jgi:hypothetical protein
MPRENMKQEILLTDVGTIDSFPKPCKENVISWKKAVRCHIALK